MASRPSDGGGGGFGRRPFFNDRRFTVAGPQRLRQNVQDLLSQFNRQFAADNPTLLHELADQLNRLQELLSTNSNGNNAAVVHQNTNTPATGRENPNNPGHIGDQAGPSNAQAYDQRQEFRDSIAFENELGDPGELSQFLSDDEDQDDDAEESSARPENAIRNDSVIVNMEIDLDGNFRVEGVNQAAAAAPAQPPPAAQAVNPDAEWQRLVTALRAPEMQRIIRVALNFGPFLCILWMKWMLTYAAGIVMLISLLATFFYVENVVETVVASSRTQQITKWRLLSTIILLSLNIGALYYFFAKDALYLALIFQPTMPLLEEKAKHLSFWTLMWLVTTTDFVAKFIFIIAKCLVVSGPTIFAAHRRKAQTYQWLEYTSHIYRHWLPTVPWACYLTVTADSTGYVHNGLCSILFLAYLFVKVKQFREKLRRWWNSTTTLLRPTSFGYKPSTMALMETGPSCSICYGEFSNPVQLSCKHIFCEECVATWLDKQKTCPMCRTQVITGDNDWKDGKTSYCVQLA